MPLFLFGLFLISYILHMTTFLGVGLARDGVSDRCCGMILTSTIWGYLEVSEIEDSGVGVLAGGMVV